MQSPQRRGLNVLRPEQKRAATAGAKNLLCCPQCVRCLRGPNLYQLLRGKADVLKAKSVRNMRRLHHCDRPLAQFAERRTKQPHFTHAGLLDQQVNKRADGPSAAGQLSRQRWISRVHRTAPAPRKLRRPPKRRVYCFRNRGRDSHWIAEIPVWMYSILHGFL